MSTADLIALAERVERAEGPDRRLDGKIGALMQRVRLQAKGHNTDGIRADENDPGHIVESIGNGWWATYYTASLDAAMTLVPQGHRICTISQAMPGREWFAKLAFIGREGGLPASGASSPSLALTAASLRAIAAEAYTHIAQATQHDE